MPSSSGPSLSAGRGPPSARPAWRPGAAGTRSPATPARAGSSGAPRGTSAGRRSSPSPSASSRRWRQRLSQAMKSERGSRKRACSWSARARCSTGRSRGSWIESAAVITSTSRRQPSRSASRIIRAIRGSIGSRASLRPIAGEPRTVTASCPQPGRSAPSSSSSCTPARTARWSGGSTNGNRSTWPSPSEVICRITLASEVRRISGSVNSGRPSKSSWL